MSASNILTAGRQAGRLDGRLVNSCLLVLSKTAYYQTKNVRRDTGELCCGGRFLRVSQRLFGAKCGAAAKKEEGYS